MQVQVGEGTNLRRNAGPRSRLLTVGLGFAVVVAMALGVARLRGWHYMSLDGVMVNMTLALLGDDTVYGPKYSETVFGALRPGTTDSELVQTLGDPLERLWWYPITTTGPQLCCTVVLDGRGQRVVDNVLRVPAGGTFRDVPGGSDAALVVRLHGKPAEETWTYAGRDWESSDSDVNYRIRQLTIRDGRVLRIEHEVYID